MSGMEAGSAAYTEGEQFQRERRTVFATNWLVFAASAQFPAPGDFVSHSFGGWPLFAIRDDDGAARAFHNVCRHQSMPVIEQPAGSCEVLRCRYHGWTYGLAGEFLDAPPRVAPTEPATELRLNPVEFAERGGFCLVRVRPSGAPPPEHLAVPGRFAGAVTTDFDANWKAAIEALLADESRCFLWPSAFIGQDADGATIVRQIVPRSFSRTRMVDLIFTEDGAVTEEIITAQQRHTAADKAAAEACQAAHAAGAAASPSSAVAGFLERIAAACAE